MTEAVRLAAPPLARRLACLFYDAFLAFGIALATSFVFSIATEMRNALVGREALAVAVWVVLGAYFAWCWTKGRTLPMQTWRIRIVDTRGQRLTPARACWRYLLCAVWVLPPIAYFSHQHITDWKPVTAAFFAWVAFWAVLSRLHPQRQFWHDHWAGTRLVDAA